MSEPLPPPPPPSYAPPPPPPAGGASSNKTLMLVLSYLGLLAIIPLVVEKDDKEIQWHAKHGLVICVLWFIVCIAVGVLSVIPFFGHLAGCFFSVVAPIGALILAVLCIMKAVNGQRFIIPGVSQYADKF
ncbi:MAG TPA: DUF4870 domain-containing protein [Thermoanaerobaculia bacterium]|nr:DUF4870 domain-containing protein [Thermoanaerobaculia bacterium]